MANYAYLQALRAETERETLQGIERSVGGAKERPGASDCAIIRILTKNPDYVTRFLDSEL